jgi:tetratricopeptide (TPR) repeat protein
MDATFYFQQAEAYLQAEQVCAAMVSYEQALALEPNQPEAWARLGSIYHHQGRPSQAINCYLEALLWDGADRYCQDLAQVLATLGLHRQAQEAASNIISNELFAEFYPLPAGWSVELARISRANQIADQILDQAIDQIIDPASFIALRPPQRQEHPVFEINGIHFPATRVTRIPWGRAIAQDWGSSIITPGGQMIADISTGLSSWIFLSRERPPVQQLPGQVLALARWGGRKYFHWLGEVLPCLDLLRRAGITRVDHIWLNGPILPFQLQTLELLGISTDCLVSSADYPHIEAEELIVPHCGQVNGWMSAIAPDFLRYSLPPKQSSQVWPTKIYLSRASTSYRRLRNEPEIIDTLSKSGFVAVQPEQLAITDQISLFAHAEAIVAPHGAALSNLVFCRPGTKVVEIFSPEYVYGCFWAIASQGGLDYDYRIGATLEHDSLLHPCYRDIYLDKTDLEDI